MTKKQELLPVTAAKESKLTLNPKRPGVKSKYRYLAPVADAGHFTSPTFYFS